MQPFSRCVAAKRFRGGLVFKAHRRLYHSTPGSRVIKKKKRRNAKGRTRSSATRGEAKAARRCRARGGQLETCQGLSPESQDQILVLTVLYVPSLLDSGCKASVPGGGGSARECVAQGRAPSATHVHGEKMLEYGTDPESYITEYTLVYEDKY